MAFVILTPGAEAMIVDTHRDSLTQKIARLEAEGFIGMRAVARIAGMHSATAHRWATEGVEVPGVGRVRLEAVRVAGRWCSSRPAVLRFIELTNHEAASTQDTPPRSPASRSRASEKAAAELARLGC
jgi:hypothetical protein